MHFPRRVSVPFGEVRGGVEELPISEKPKGAPYNRKEAVFKGVPERGGGGRRPLGDSGDKVQRAGVPGDVEAVPEGKGEVQAIDRQYQ